MVALEHIALLGEGHCLTLIQQLVTGQIDISTATVTDVSVAEVLETLLPQSNSHRCPEKNRTSLLVTVIREGNYLYK